MRVNSRIQINQNRIRQLTLAGIKALEKTAEALHTEVVQAEIMPRDTGTLQDESTFIDYNSSKRGKVQIVSSTPYARRMYFHPEYNFQTYENAFAQGKWYSPWLSGGVSEDFCKEAFEKFFRREGGL